MKKSLLTLLAIAGLARAETPARLDLTGRVTDSAGAPVPGVTVVILAAGPRKGNSPLCPSLYDDCGKRTTSDADGQFRLPSLDPAMDFCIAALAPGYESYVNSSLLPEKGPVPVKLRARDLAKLPPSRHVAGRLIDPDGRPVAGAILSAQGVLVGDTTRWGGNDVTESQVITDAQGEFHLAGRKDFDAVFVTIDAPGLAERWARLEPGQSALLRLKPGVTVTGRLLRQGQPLAGVTLAGSSVERECGKYFNSARVTTGADGAFVFPHLPPGVKFRLYGNMASLGAQGGGFLQEITTPAEDSTLRLGDLPVGPAYRITGQVILADGKPLPPATRLMLDRGDISDVALAALDGEGRFEFAGVPPEQVAIYVNLPGYRVSAKNRSLSPNDHATLIGRISGDVTGLKILLEPGARPNWSDLPIPTEEQREAARQQPLQGIP